MFAAVMMPPVFGTGSTSPERRSMMPAFASSPFRPSRPSPLSSSPIRASSPPASSHTLSSQLDTQSSPIQSSSASASASVSACAAVDNANTAAALPWFSASTSSLPEMNAQAPQPQPLFNFGEASSSSSSSTSSSKTTTFRFASRPTKPVPRGQQGRDTAQQTRRSLFLRNVRQRADDRSWDRRNFEQELQKLEWWSLEHEIRQARETDVMSMLTEQDIEDAADWAESPTSSMPSFFMHSDAAGDDSNGAHVHRHGRNGSMYYDRVDEDDEEAMDERMADLLAMEEEAELEAMIASMDTDGTEDPSLSARSELPAHPSEDQATPPQNRPASTVYSDDGDYDAIFSEYLSGAAGGEDTEMGSL